MEVKDIDKKHKEISAAVSAGNLGDAVMELKPLCEASGDWDLKSRLYEIETSYRYMKEYMRQGLKDAGRTALYETLLCKAAVLNDLLRVALSKAVSPRLFFDKMRCYEKTPFGGWNELAEEVAGLQKDIAMCNLMNNAEEKLKLCKRFSEVYKEIFYKTWLNCRWDNGDAEAIRTVFSEKRLPVNVLSAMTSAVMLSLMECFDLRKIMFILDLCLCGEPMIRARAVLALLVAAYRHGYVLKFCREFNSRMSLLKDDLELKKNVNEVAVQYLRGLETMKINKKMNEEIIPEILKAHKDLGGTRFKDISIISEETLNELNPDWQKKLENSGFEKRMKEMSDLQSEGADVYMGAFSQLKSFPFFYDMANWFYPFDEDCYEIVGCLGGMKGSMLGVIVRSPFFCNSDKYSMCFMMSQVPQQQRELMMRQFDGQDEAVRMLRDEYENFESRNCSNQYIQDLYRFFKLFSRKREFDDIFRWGIAMLKTECLSSLFEWETGCLNIADFLFKNGHFGDACQYYAGSGMTEKAEVVQKMGFCRQKLNDFSEAKRLYEKADLIEPDNAWTMKHLAMCCIVDNDIDAAIDIYRKLEARYENDWNIIFQLGKCFLRKEAYVDAMKCFYKSDYLKPGHAPVQRTMAWTLFCMGKPDEALPLYEKIKPEDRTQNDYINMGHVLWICGNVEKAVEAYKKGVALSDKSIFATIMDEDSTLLHGHGLDKADIAIMKDIVLND